MFPEKQYDVKKKKKSIENLLLRIAFALVTETKKY